MSKTNRMDRPNRTVRTNVTDRQNRTKQAYKMYCECKYIDIKKNHVIQRSNQQTSKNWFRSNY